MCGQLENFYFDIFQVKDFLPVKLFLFEFISNAFTFSLLFVKTLEAAEGADCSLMDRDIMQVVFALAKAGHHQHVPEISERLRHERGYIPGDCVHTV